MRCVQAAGVGLAPSSEAMGGQLVRRLHCSPCLGLSNISSLLAKLDASATHSHSSAYRAMRVEQSPQARRGEHPNSADRHALSTRAYKSTVLWTYLRASLDPIWFFPTNHCMTFDAVDNSI